MPENVQTRGKLDLDIRIKHVINVEHTFIFIGDVELSYEMEIVIVREEIKVDMFEISYEVS